jgi:heptosyltransferase-2
VGYSQNMNGHGSSGRCPERERIVVICTRYLGDTLLAIPFLRNLRAAHPGAVIEAVASGAAFQSLADCPYIDALLAWPESAGIVRRAAWLRSRRYARCYLLKRSLSAALIGGLAGIPQRIGFATECAGPLLSRAVAVPRGRHQAERYLDLLRAEGHAIDDGHNENWVDAESDRTVAPLLATLPADRPRVLLAIRGTDGRRFWPDAAWARLVTWLVTERDAEIVFCGAPHDADAHAAVRAAVPAHVSAHIHDFSLRLSLRQAAAVAARMDLCVGIDTGLVHLAASFAVPVVVLVGPTDPNQWAPWGTRHEVVRAEHLVRTPLARLRAWMPGRRPPALRWPQGRGRMDEIPVADVMARIAGLLPEPAPRPELRTLDLRSGSFRYEVTATLPADAADEPATKPLAQAH